MQQVHLLLHVDAAIVFIPLVFLHRFRCLLILLLYLVEDLLQLV